VVKMDTKTNHFYFFGFIAVEIKSVPSSFYYFKRIWLNQCWHNTYVTCKCHLFKIPDRKLFVHNFTTPFLWGSGAARLVLWSVVLARRYQILLHLIFAKIIILSRIIFVGFSQLHYEIFMLVATCYTCYYSSGEVGCPSWNVSYLK